MMRVTRTRPVQRVLTVGALVAGLMVPLAALAVPAQAAVHDTTLVSRATDGSPGDGDSFWSSLPGSAAISADGRFVVFESQADNLSDDDNNAYVNLFVRDRQAGTTTLVSRASGGAAANGDSSHPSISADGRYVAFASAAPNLSDQDIDTCTDPYWGGTTPCSNVHVRDLQAGTTTLVSRTTGGTAAIDSSYSPSISPDGSAVVFGSFAANLSTEDVNECVRHTETGDTYVVPCPNNFVRNLQDNSTRYLAPGSQWGSSCGASISADGRFAAIETGQVEVVDLQSGTSTVVSRKNGADGVPAGGWCPSISADGSKVAFVAYNDLVDGFGGGVIWDEVYVRDLQAGTTKVISRADPSSGEWNKYSGHPAISADGRFVAFDSKANYLSAFDKDGTGDAFVRDLATDSVTYVSRASGETGAGGDSGSGDPSISADGRVVAFSSAATNLSTEDNDAYSDVFVRELVGAGEPPLPPAQADLSLSMTASNTAPAVGAEVTFTVTLTNSGPATATGVGVGDWLPEGGLTYVSATASRGTYDPAPGLWRLTSLASGDTATLQLVGKATTAGTKTNTAAVNAAGQADPDSKPGNSDATEDDQASVTVTATQPVSCPTVTAVADADSWIGQNASTATHGTETTMKVRSKSYSNARALVRFTLPAIPDGCQITDVKLRLNATTATPGRTLRAVALAAPWAETAVTWRNQPATTGTAASASSAAGWVQWTVTAQVNGMYSGANHGFHVRDASESGSGVEQRFHSRESGTNPPELIITSSPR